MGSASSFPDHIHVANNTKSPARVRVGSFKAFTQEESNNRLHNVARSTLANHTQVENFNNEDAETNQRQSDETMTNKTIMFEKRFKHMGYATIAPQESLQFRIFPRFYHTHTLLEYRMFNNSYKNYISIWVEDKESATGYKLLCHNYVLPNKKSILITDEGIKLSKLDEPFQSTEPKPILNA